MKKSHTNSISHELLRSRASKYPSESSFGVHSASLLRGIPAQNKKIRKTILKKTKHFFSSFKFILLVIFLVSGLIFMYFFVLKDIPSTTQIGRADFPESTRIYDRGGKLLYTIYESKNQTFIPIDKIPKHLKNATIAIEDRDFYKHAGIDPRGITRAFYYTLFKGELQGGSTITQQLVKNSILTPERTITRKIKEIILAFVVEALYSKDRIFEIYLNQVPYGGTAWGVEAASQVYFEKSVKDLNLAEAAFLAGLPEAPSLYSPFGSQPELGRKRQKDVLSAMKRDGYISEKEEKKALSYTLKFSKIQDKIYAPHFVFYIKKLLVDKYGQRMVEQGGLLVTTSLDLELQNFAQDTVATEVAKLSRYNVTNGAAVITNPASGEIIAMVGSHDYFDEEHDGNVNVALAKRQPGSSIKPINYAVGLAKGYTAATPFVDEKKCFPSVPGEKEYCPQNYDGKFHGAVQMRTALGSSLNIPAVKMLKANGVEAMIATASAMGITTFADPDRYGLSLTLGGGEVSMIEMAEAFGVFANVGYRIPLHPILKVVNNKGEVLEEYKAPKSPIFGQKVMNEGIAYIVSHILQDNGARSLAFGTASPLVVGRFPVSVKTGTTNDFRDNWTIGYTPNNVAVVWVGNNDNTPMKGIVSGVTGAAPIWHEIMEELVGRNPPKILPKPDSVVGLTICSTSGLLPQPEGDPNRCPTRFEYFIKGTQPNRTDPGRQKVFIDKATGDLPKEGQTDNLEEREEIVISDLLSDRYCISCPHPQTEESKNQSTSQ